MTLLKQDQRNIQTTRTRLAVTTPVTVFDALDNDVNIEDILVTNTGAGTATITLDVYDAVNTTAYVIVAGHVLKAAAAVDPNTNEPTSVWLLRYSHVLRSKWLLRATTSAAANVVHVHVTAGRTNKGKQA